MKTSKPQNLLYQTNEQKNKLLFGDHPFRCPKNHTNVEKAFLKFLEEVKNICLFSKGHIL